MTKRGVFVQTLNIMGGEDVESIALLPIKHSNGEIVFQQLEETIDRTGLPREIIGDHGSDLKSEIEKFGPVRLRNYTKPITKIRKDENTK